MPKSMQLATLLAVLVLAGCGSSPKANFYTLGSDAPPPRAPAAPYRIAIGIVTVPDLIDRPQIVTRTGANQVTIDEFARWAEPLQGEIPRVIAANLADARTVAILAALGAAIMAAALVWPRRA